MEPDTWAGWRFSQSVYSSSQPPKSEVRCVRPSQKILNSPLATQSWGAGASSPQATDAPQRAGGATSVGIRGRLPPRRCRRGLPCKWGSWSDEPTRTGPRTWCCPRCCSWYRRRNRWRNLLEGQEAVVKGAVSCTEGGGERLVPYR